MAENENLYNINHLLTTFIRNNGLSVGSNQCCNRLFDHPAFLKEYFQHQVKKDELLTAILLNLNYKDLS
jgi:hypothetical protein